MNTTARRFAVQETNCQDMDYMGGTLFWNFTAWSSSWPDTLLDAGAAQRELERLQASLSYKAERLSVVDIESKRARGKAAGDAQRAAAEALGYDAIPKGPARDAARVILRAVNAAALAAFDAGVADAAAAA